MSGSGLSGMSGSGGASGAGGAGGISSASGGMSGGGAGGMSGGGRQSIGGQASDIEITVNEIRKLKKELYDIYAFHTNKTSKQIEKDSDRDYWLTAIEAKEYGAGRLFSTDARAISGP